MTDNEIIKAWEKILATGDAPIGEHWGCSITTKLAKETFDMLNRQKAKIENLGEKIVMQMGLITEQKAEIEKLEEMIELGDYSSYSAYLAIKDRQRKNAEDTNELKAEIERLQTEKDNLIKTYGECMIEVVKEFAERLCKDRVSNDPVVIAVKAELKEMTE